MLDEFRQLFQYNTWANARMLDSLEPLTSEELHRPIGGSFPSIHATLVHMARAEWVWLMRWKGDSPANLPSVWGGGELPEMRAAWDELRNEQIEFLDGLTNDRLGSPLSYRNTRGEAFSAPLAQLLRHVVNHATYHRGQVTTLIRQLGHTPLNTDLIQFYREPRDAAGDRR
jgi:uncharacterized damage-inducible protein DinB